MEHSKIDLENNKVEAEEILFSIKKGLDDIKYGRIHSIDKLWDELDD